MSSDTGRGRQGQMYRSPFVRYGIALVALWVAYMMVWGLPDKWRTAPSLHWATRTCHVPFPLWGVLFVVYAALLVYRPWRWAGFLMGWVLFAFFTAALFFTVNTDGPKSAVAIAAFVDVCIYHGYSVVQAMNAERLDEAEPPK